MTSPTISYVLSNIFPYERSILRDSGPNFASSYGWRVSSIDTFLDIYHDIYIVDNRLDESEIHAVKEKIRDSKSIFLLKICDPYADHAIHQLWYSFAESMLDKPRVHYLLNYHPVEWTANLFVKANISKFIVAPYPYESDRERKIDHRDRQYSLILSGALTPSIYPLRAKIRMATRFPPLSFQTRLLKHPGYGENGPIISHKIIGEDYINELAKYRLGAICSSRCRIEFMKYVEFSYAGLVPVGDLPATLLDCPTDAWIPWRKNVLALSARLRDFQETQYLSENYRAFMRRTRGVDMMRAAVNARLAALS